VGHVDGRAGEFAGEVRVLAGEVRDGVAEVVVGVLEGVEFAGNGAQVLEEESYHFGVVNLALFGPFFEEVDERVEVLDRAFESLDFDVLCGRHTKR
jgi:hypothetical protein